MRKINWKYRFLATHAITLAVTFGLLSQSLGAFAEPNTAPIVSLNAPYYYSSSSIAYQLQALHDRYPEYTLLKVLGHSRDGRPIYALIMTADARGYGENPDRYRTAKRHYLFEAGMHSREVINPVVTVALIERYLLAIETPALLGGTDVKALLSDNVFHFVPLSNPDGFDLAKFGISKIQSPSLKARALTFGKKGFSNLKSNAGGVDLNRNFPDVFYNEATGKWQPIWGIQSNGLTASGPSLAYYKGPQPGSEPETQALMAYADSLPFNAVVSFHSRGHLIYWHYWMYGSPYNSANKTLASRIGKITGYALSNSGKSESSSGYFSDYIANTKQKPALTLETLKSGESYHTKDAAVYRRILTELTYVPKTTADWGATQPYEDHIIYRDGLFYGDFSSSKMANAIAYKLGANVYPNDLIGSPPLPPLALESDALASSLEDLILAAIPTSTPSDIPSLMRRLNDRGFVNLSSHQRVSPALAAQLLYFFDYSTVVSEDEALQYAIQAGYLTQINGGNITHQALEQVRIMRGK